MTNLIDAFENMFDKETFSNYVAECVAKGADNVQPYIRHQTQNKPARRRELRTWVKVAAGIVCVAMMYALLVLIMIIGG